METIADLERLARSMDNANHFGALHIVIEDGNLEDDHIEWCMTQKDITREENDLARALLLIPMHLRVAAYEMQGYID